ncbi:MAG: ssDNA-binding domain-containing protein [Solobacterium sp.]|nr:ssDNA-binding domain-containing protein [Solobacterium sp.]
MNRTEFERISEQLQKGVRDVYESGRYKNYLKTMSRFHGYSASNCILIFMQKPDASYVAGYQTWKNQFQRFVRKGEKGIRIIAPARIHAEEEEEVRLVFRTVSVFDISQTEGEPLPSYMNAELEGEVDDYDSFLEAAVLACRIPVCFEDIGGGVHGYFSPKDRQIVIQKDMSPLQTVKTLIHEMAHSILHDGEEGSMKERRQKEIEAESTACAVCCHYGLDSSEYSFGYIAGWAADRELKQLKESMDVIREASDRIISDIDRVRSPHTAAPFEKQIRAEDLLG